MRKSIVLMAVCAAVGAAFGGAPVNPKLPMSFGVDSKGYNRFAGEFKEIELSFGGKTYHSGPAKAGDRIAPFPSKKEFREERFYGDFVKEKHHRHISHLVGLCPGPYAGPRPLMRFRGRPFAL